MNRISRSIQINGIVRSVESTTITELLAEVGLSATRRGIAVAVDGVLVLRGAWADTTLSAGQAVEIITAAQGG